MQNSIIQTWYAGNLEEKRLLRCRNCKKCFAYKTRPGVIGVINKAVEGPLEGMFARHAPGAPGIQMNVLAIYYNALPPKTTPSSSP